MYTRSDVVGLVILYNSEAQVISNIQSYVYQIDHLIVVDNSEVANFELVSCIEKINNLTYVKNETNLGVAYALNQAASIAIENNYQFLLTMDDDTTFPVDGIQKMLNYINQYGIENLGIIASQSDPKLFSNTVKTVPYAITSGNLLNVSAYKICGHFLNELFIDFVDHEYCFRLNKYGYRVIEINYIHLEHNLGQQKQLMFLNCKVPIYWTSHNPLRIYYKTRNCIFSLKSYSLLGLRVKYVFYKEVFKDLYKIVFLEDKKQTRASLFVRGLYDGLKGNLGKRTFKI